MVEDIRSRILPFLEKRGAVAEIHRATGIPQSTIHNWKQRNLPSLIEAHKLCLYLGKDIQWLVTGKSAMQQKYDRYESEMLNLLRGQPDDIKLASIGAVRGMIESITKKGQASKENAG